MKYTRLITIFIVLAAISIVVLLLLPDEPSYWFVIKVCFILIIVWLAMLLFRYEETSLVGREALGDTSEASGEPSKYTNTRISAMKWWNYLSSKYRQELTNRYCGNARPNTLTGDEIQYIFERELNK